jgi:hypothetical protein
MGWSIGYDSNWKRDIGYGVPAYCDHPHCGKKIDRGLAYVCGSDPWGGEHGCGLFFCGEHLLLSSRGQLCVCCYHMGETTFEPTPDHPEWIQHKLTDPSWSEWRSENTELVAKMREQLTAAESAPPETK